MTAYTVDPETRRVFEEARLLHPNDLSFMTYLEKYSRFDYDLGRREVWPETVARATAFLRELSEDRLDEDTYQAIHHGILNMEVLPSMRLLAMAGPTGRRNNISLYNCGYVPIDSIESFVEALIISMSGTGLGYSVEQKHVARLPYIIQQKTLSGLPYPKSQFRVPDSAEGWAQALRYGLEHWFLGFDIEFDFSDVRPAGAILRTKGGRSSGPEPLRNLLSFARKTILGKQGGRLSTLDCHDIMGNIALGAVSGGHRRSAMIALYSWDDQEMRHCKDGKFWESAPWRTTANNSAVIDDVDLSDGDIREHFGAMVAGGNGEPGIFSRVAAIGMRPNRRRLAPFGTNPCAEISLRPMEFCNLTEVVLRPTDTPQDIYRKASLAAIIGTIQATATYFPGLRKEWSENCQEERLLGVGFTGQMDCPTFWNPSVMEGAKNVAVITNHYYAKFLGINQAASVTCVKPSGSTSILVNSSSGLHARWAPYYERNIRLMSTGPVAKALLMQGFPMDPENGQTWENHDTLVAHFPIASPPHAVTRGQRSALEQCEYWKAVKLNLTEHNPSVTITYRPEEVQAVEDWVIENREILGGMAFLPHFDEDINLKQMPYREISQEECHRLMSETPVIDASLITAIETEDQTSAAQEVACSAGLCDV